MSTVKQVLTDVHDRCRDCGWHEAGSIHANPSAPNHHAFSPRVTADDWRAAVLEWASVAAGEYDDQDARAAFLAEVAAFEEVVRAEERVRYSREAVEEWLDEQLEAMRIAMRDVLNSPDATTEGLVDEFVDGAFDLVRDYALFAKASRFHAEAPTSAREPHGAGQNA